MKTRPEDIQFSVITTDEQLADMVKRYEGKAAFAFDVETTGEFRLDAKRNVVTWISFAHDESCDVIPIQHPNGDYTHTTFPLLTSGEKRQAAGLPLRDSDYSKDPRKAIKHFSSPPAQLHHAEVFEAIAPLLNGDAMKIGHNLKFDLKSVAKYNGGRVPAGRYFDTLIASWLIDTSRIGRLSLMECVRRELRVEMEKGVGACVENHSFNEVAQYSAFDSYRVYRLADKLIPQLGEHKLGKVMLMEMDLLGALADMELVGAPIDVDALVSFRDNLESEIEQAKGEIFRLAGKPFNLNSNLEKQKLLFTPKKDGGRGLRPRIKTASGAPSVSAEALEKLVGKDALIDALLHHAELDKLMSTYIIPYLGGEVERTTGGKTKTVTRETMLVKGRIHTEFVQNGAETGRMSSRNPNLQNVPNASTAHGKAIRDLFCAPEGYVLVCADYSQIEPRIIASLSKDPILLGAYKEGRDVYTSMVEGDILRPYGLPRAGGKLAVLAMSYGVGPEKIESDLHLKPGEGEDLLRAFEKQFAAVYRYKRKVVAEALNQRPDPYVKTLMGRRRYLPNLRAGSRGEVMRGERQAFNTRIQGTAADIMKVAIIRAHRMLPPEAKLILTVHDELLTLCPEEMGEQVKDIICEAMEGINILDIPLIAEAKIAKTWGDAK